MLTTLLFFYNVYITMTRAKWIPNVHKLHHNLWSYLNPCGLMGISKLRFWESFFPHRISPNPVWLGAAAESNKPTFHHYIPFFQPDLVVIWLLCVLLQFAESTNYIFFPLFGVHPVSEHSGHTIIRLVSTEVMRKLLSSTIHIYTKLYVVWNYALSYSPELN